MAERLEKNDSKINFEIETKDLCPAQVRLYRRLVSNVVQVMTTKDENNYFAGSADLMRLAAAIIKQSNFSAEVSTENIPYGEQALEYSVEVLQDQISASKVVTYDN